MIRHLGITTVVDAGANSGQYAHYLRESGFEGTILSFEPLDGPFAELQTSSANDPRWTPFHCGLGAETARLQINISGNGASSSFLPITDRSIKVEPNTGFVGAQPADVKRLDEFAHLFQTNEKILLKIDTQGYEDKVLAGAGELLRQVALIECELSTVPLYEGQLLFMDMIRRLDSLGFRAVNFEPEFIEPQTGYCLQLNGIFARL